MIPGFVSEPIMVSLQPHKKSKRLPGLTTSCLATSDAGCQEQQDEPQTPSAGATLVNRNQRVPFAQIHTFKQLLENISAIEVGTSCVYVCPRSVHSVVILIVACCLHEIHFIRKIHSPLE